MNGPAPDGSAGAHGPVGDAYAGHGTVDGTIVPPSGAADGEREAKAEGVGWFATAPLEQPVRMMNPTSAVLERMGSAQHADKVAVEPEVPHGRLGAMDVCQSGMSQEHRTAGAAEYGLRIDPALGKECGRKCAADSVGASPLTSARLWRAYARACVSHQPVRAARQVGRIADNLQRKRF